MSPLSGTKVVNLVVKYNIGIFYGSGQCFEKKPNPTRIMRQEIGRKNKVWDRRPKRSMTQKGIHNRT